MSWFANRSFRVVFALLLPCSLISSAAAIGQAPEAQPPAEQAVAQPPDDAVEAAPPAEGAAKEAERPKIVIPDEPRTVDPARFLPPKLTENATVVFEDASLREVVAWLNDRDVATLVDAQGLEEAALTLDVSMDDSLTDDPVYFLLDRLDSLDLDWYVEDDIVRITSRESADRRVTTLSHNVSDLYDADYDAETLIDLITSTIDPESWPEFGGTGSASIRGLGDVLFVSQTERNHRLVLGLLAALRKHGRMTYIAEPPQHELRREGLQRVVTANFEGMRLEQALADLAGQAQVDIRLDLQGLDEASITPRTPVTLSLKQTRLETTLDALLSDHDLDWMLQGGAIRITSVESTHETMKSAVYDVRDLTLESDDFDSLIDAITSTLDSESWPEFGGTGEASIRGAGDGVLVVSQNERNLTELANLLARYREAIALSKQRKPRDEEDPNEILEVYYRLPRLMADDLLTHLPELVAPETWRTAEEAGRPGTIRLIASAPEKPTPAPDGTASPASELFSARATLVISHTRATHETIESVIGRVANGDRKGPLVMGMGGGGGFGGGGFGGGMGGGAEPAAPSGGGGFGGFQ